MNYLIVIARSAATKQSSGAMLDCFASLAMTIHRKRGIL